MKKRFLLCILSALRCLRFPAAAQGPEYVITEMELIRLESISESLTRDRQSLQSQANGLTERLRVQEKKANSLTEKLQQAERIASGLKSQLQTERKTLKALRQSYNKSEQEAAETIAKKQTLIDEQKDKLHRRMIAVITLSAILTIILFAIGAKYFLKYKFSLFHPP